jgi:hypothetical protein
MILLKSQMILIKNIVSIQLKMKKLKVIKIGINLLIVQMKKKLIEIIKKIIS